MLNIGICDDEPAILAGLVQSVHTWARESGQLCEIRDFASAEQLLFSFAETKYDILLLDIQMPGMDGIALSKRIRETDERVQLVFITAVPDYIAEGYEVSALHYLLKPVEQSKLYAVLDKACKNLHTAEPVLLWQSEGELQRIPLPAIRYAEAKGHYVTLYTDMGAFTRKATLSEVLEHLDGRFFRCQRSFAVNLHRVKRASRTEVELINGETLPLSRNLYDAINREIIRLYPEE